jgi:hypothetical protein
VAKFRRIRRKRPSAVPPPPPTERKPAETLKMPKLKRVGTIDIGATDSDWRVFSSLCEAQATEQEIAAIMRCSVGTISRWVKKITGLTFGQYKRTKRGLTQVSIRKKQLEKAIDEGNVQMLIWLGKQYLGQAEKLQTENQNTIANITPEKMAYARQIMQRMAMEQRMLAAASNGHGNGNGNGLSNGNGKSP